MRMINETALSEAIRDYFIKKIDKDEYKVDTVDCHADIQAILRSQPTAYDSDKVVEQLRKKAYNCGSHMNIYGKKAEWMAEGYYGAIEIVKKGGVADET